MNSSRPYIIRAIYEWIVDNDCTPHLLVDVDHEGVDVPQSYVTDGQIVLNISPNAVVGLELGNDLILFNGRFGGVATDIVVPIRAILGIYARENGQGMVFEPEDDPEIDPPTPQGPTVVPSTKTKKKPSKTKAKPSLRAAKA